MDKKNHPFDRFTRAIAHLNLDDKQARPTAHTASVVDFSNWDDVRQELESVDSTIPAPETPPR
jgi:hypothetical protein